MCLLAAVHLGAAAAIQSAATPLSEYTGDAPRFLHRWFGMTALIAPLVYLPAAAVLGALATPSAARFEETQSMLLTRLLPIEVCIGRLLASLWPVISAIMTCCAVGFILQLVWRPLLPGSADGYLTIALMHIVMLSSVLCIGAVAFYCAMRRRPGSVPARGAGLALAAAALALLGLFLANPLIRKLENPTPLIYGLLLANPATAGATALHADVLRYRWIYERTDAPEYPFSYPPPWATCALFAGGAAGALCLSSVRLRRAYR